MSKESTEATPPVEKNAGNATVDAELAEAVKMMDEIDNAEAEEPKTEAAPPEGAEAKVEAPATEEEKPAAEDAPQPVEIDDALTERAVRAGLSLAEIKGISSKEVLEGIVGRLEDGARKPKDDDGGDKPDGGDEEDSAADEADPFADIDWDEFDPQIATVVKGLAAQNAAMRKEIASLKRAGESAQAQSFFETQYGKLDEGVRKHVDAVAKGKLKQKFDMLEAGYKAVKVEVKRADVFQEAARLVLGDKLDAANAESDAAKLAKRKELAIAPPTRSRSGGQPAKTEDDVEQEIVSELMRELS